MDGPIRAMTPKRLAKLLAAAAADLGKPLSAEEFERPIRELGRRIGARESEPVIIEPSFRPNQAALVRIICGEVGP